MCARGSATRRRKIRTLSRYFALLAHRASSGSAGAVLDLELKSRLTDRSRISDQVEQ
jgi:hypothetical protein